MKILVILTGGTIGSCAQKNYIAVDETAKYQILAEYRAHREAADVEFETLCPYTLLSENLRGSYVNRLVESVSSAVSREDIDGVIVTHGTDTLQFSAAALSLTVRTKLPVVLVSANYILSDPRSNGLTNFSNAVDFIRERKAGIFVSYANHGEAPRILNGNQLLFHSAYDDALHGLVAEQEKQAIYKDVLLTDLCPVLYVRVLPGMLFPAIPENAKAILLETYHSGTLPTETDALKEFSQAAGLRQIPVYVVGVEERLPYESTEKLKGLPLHILPKVSPVYAYMNLWYKYSKV